jgi:uncharacterized protein involved in type VI secretion and phage assembly
MSNPISRFFERDERETREGGMVGLYYAEVDHFDEELGGYILRWLSGNLTDLSAPARVASFMAGSERGGFFMPEEGDEVVVGFERGNLDQPVILGALWSDVDEPPPQADATASNNVRTIVSRGGHEFTFDDDANTVLIKTAEGPSILLEDDSDTLTIATDGGLTITLTADSEINITADGKPINITCSKLTVDGDVDITGDLKVGEGPSTTISGNEITGAT